MITQIRAGIVADWAAGGRRMVKKEWIKSEARREGGSERKFWADVGRSDSDRLRTSAGQQTVAPKGASEQVGEARTSGRKADQVYDLNGGAEEALPDVDRPAPEVERAMGGMLSWMSKMYLADRPRWGAVPVASGGDTRPMARRPSRADGVADGGMPWAYKRDRTRPMAEPVMRSRSRKTTTTTDSNLLGPQEGSLALPRVCR